MSEAKDRYYELGVHFVAEDGPIDCYIKELEQQNEDLFKILEKVYKNPYLSVWLLREVKELLQHHTMEKV